MVELIIRSYRIFDMTMLINVTIPNVNGTLPGTLQDKMAAVFRISPAYQLLLDLSIGYVLHIPSNHDIFPIEVIMQMDRHQYSLWRIAGGDRWCVHSPSMNTNRLDIPTSIENEVAAALGSDWQIDFFDGTVNFIRGDAMVSVYEDGSVRGVCGRFIAYTDYWEVNIRKALLRFPFITTENIAPFRSGQ